MTNSTNLFGGLGSGGGRENDKMASEHPTTLNGSPRTFIDTLSSNYNHHSGFYPKKMDQLAQRRIELQ